MVPATWTFKFHSAVLAIDIPKLARIYNDPKAYAVIRRLIDKALNEIFQDPAGQGAALRRPPLAGWRKYKFHSTSRPAPYARPDMRIIYRVQGQEVQVLAIGRRLPGHPDDIYAVGDSRS